MFQKDQAIPDNGNNATFVQRQAVGTSLDILICAVLLSTNVTLAAPRLMASKPIRPEPANKSRNLALICLPFKMLKKACLTLDEVGRTSWPLGLLIALPRNEPPVIITLRYP